MKLDPILMKNALEKSLERGTFFALELHAKNQRLVSHYERYGFQLLEKKVTFHMILPYSDISSFTQAKNSPKNKT